MFRAGADWSLNDRNTLGFLVNGNFYLLHREMESNTWVTTPEGYPRLSLDSYNDAFFSNKSLTYNLNYRRIFSQEGQELTVDIDYSIFDGDNTDLLTNYFYYGAKVKNAADSVVTMNSNFATDIEIKVAKADYFQPLGGKWGVLELGIKSSLVHTGSDVLFHLRKEEEWTKDPRRSNQFKYEEGIHAAYLNWRGNIGSYNLQVGLRGEQTSYEGQSNWQDSVINIRDNYLELFPSVFVSRKLNETHQLNFSFSRRIERPSYQSLNPFIVYRDFYTYTQGNPQLRPQFTNAYELRHSFKGTYHTSFSYSRTNNAMTYVPEEDPETQANVGIVRNLHSLTNFNISLSAPVSLAKWWEVQNNFSGFYNQLKGNYLGEEINNSQISFSANVNNQFILPRGFSAEIITRYNSPAVYGVIRAKAEFGIYMGVQRQFWNKNATLRLNVNDLLNTMRYIEIFEYQNVKFTTKQYWESRQARLTFTYRFGNKEVKSERNRRSGSEEERSRIGSG